MKKFLQHRKGVFALLLALFLGMGTANAAQFSAVCSTGQTLYYNITDATNHYVEITCPGNPYNGQWDGFTKPTGAITLPSSVTYNGVNYTVKAIGEFAFYKCSGLTGTLTIPSSVNTIGNDAFNGCSGFTGSLTIPNSVTTIGPQAFAECSGFNGSLSIPNSVTTIGFGAFGWCPNFTGTLTLPNSLAAIEDFTFFLDSGFTGSLTIPNTVTSIGESAFGDCGFTGTLTLGNSLTSIGVYAFDYCTGFTGSLSIPNSVTTIGNCAFRGCTGFTGSLTLGNSVTTIGNWAFFNCFRFTGSLIIPNSVTTIGNLAFDNCFGFTGSLTIGTGVTSMGTSAFSYCSGLTSIMVLPETPPVLGTDAFDGVPSAIPVYVPCGSMAAYQTASGWNEFTNIQDPCYDPLTYSINPDGVSVTVTGHVDGTAATGTLTIPETKTIDGVTYTVTAIGSWAFDGCTGLTGSLDIPNSVTTIGNDAFFDCSGFDGSLTIPNSVTTIGSNAFYGCSGFDGSLTIPNSVTTIGNGAFSWCTNFAGTLTLSNSLTTIENFSFYHCESLTGSLIIPNTVTSIGENAFGCCGFTGSLTLGNSVTSIGDFAFDACHGFTGSLTIPNSVTTIGLRSFYACDGMTGTLTLGNSVTTIDDWAFNSCTGFTSIMVYPETPPDLGEYVFQWLSPTIPVTVLCGSLEDYQTTPGWSDFSNWQCNMCSPKSLPYTYGFEDEDEFGCWTMLNCDDDTGIKTYARHTGNYGFRFYFNTNPPQYLISPEFEGTSGMIVSFYYKNYDDEYPETFQVGYSTTTNSPSAFIWHDEVTADDRNTWMLYEDSFPQGTKYVAVKLTSYDKFCLYLDDFSFEPSCSEPSDLTVANITSNSADLYWTGDQDSYNVRYRMVPNGSWAMASFVDNFESGLVNWTLIDADGDDHNWSLNTDLHLNASPYGGDDMVVSESWTHTDGGLDPDNFLVTPQVALGGTVTFWASAVDHVYFAEHFGIAVSTNSNTDPADFTMVQEWTMTAKGEPYGGPRGTRSQGTWYQYTVDLSAYAGQTGYIAIRHFNCHDQDALCVDDFSYGNEISSNTLVGLNPLTTYEVQVQHICPYGFSEWSEPVSFTTAIPTFPYGDYIGKALYDVQTNFGARTWTHVWPDGKVNFAFMTASIKGYSDRGTGIGTYDSANDVWIPSMGRVENERTGFGSIAQYGANGIVVAAHTNMSNIYIIPDKDDITTGSAVKVGSLDSTHEPYWPNVMTSGANRDIIHVIAQGSDDFVVYYFRSRDGGLTWDRQNVILPYMGTDYCINWKINCCYWMETTDDNCLALVVNNPWSDGMVLYSYDDGDTWERKVFYKHPNPFGSFEDPFYYPRWTSCQWDSQHHLHVLYELGAVDSNEEYLDLGGVAYWNETMPYNANGTTVSAFEGNLVPGQPFVMESAYLENDIYRSWWHYTDATHEMWPEYIGYLAPLTDEGDPEDPYQASEFNIENEDLGQHGYYRSGVCGYPVLCMVPNSDEMVAVWSALDENHMDVNGNYYYKIFASYSKNKGATWSPMVQLTKDFDNAEFVYNQAAVVGRKLVIATQTDGETGTYYNGYYGTDTDAYDSYYLGMVFDLDDLFDTSSSVQTVVLSAGWNWFSTYIELDDPVELLEMLQNALGDNATVISASEMYTEYYGNGFWIGDLNEVGITNEQMYMVEIVNDCEIELEGAVANPADHAITIYPGWNWIGFPSSEELSLEDALADFEAEEGDVFSEPELYTEYGFGMWIGDVATLVPGRGYMYYSNSTQPKTLVFPSTSKGKNVFLRKRK